MKEPEDEPDAESCEGWCMCLCLCCFAMCMLLGCPLLLILCCAPCWLWKASRHKKDVKGRVDKKRVKDIFDFQPALPNWKDYITKETKNTINAFSIANVLFEGVVLLTGSTALSLWLMSYDSYCTGACPEQIFIFIFLIMVMIIGVFAIYSLSGIVSSKKLGNGKFLDILMEIWNDDY